MTAAFGISCAIRMARRFATFIFRRRWKIIARFIARILSDPDLQDARARWPFVNMWDNHEFSWMGWQSLERFGGKNLPAQTRKVAANQAFFEYRPARITKPSGPSLDRFDPPQVVDAPVTRFDEHGLGQEPNNLTAIGSLKGYRALRWGRNVELIVTDQRSYRSESPTDQPEAEPLSSDDFPDFMSEEAHGNSGRGTNLQWRPAAGDDSLRRRRDRKFLQEPASPDNSWRRTESVVPGAPAQLESDLEDLGQHHRHARHACRPAKLATGHDEAVAGERLRHFPVGGSRHCVCGARGDLRLRRGQWHHGIRHGGRRPAQFLGGTGSENPAT